MVTLRFGEPMRAMINARAWDQTHHEWLGNTDEMFFDAVHRFLLVRFPGSAEAIHEKLSAGYELESATLVLHWEKQEFKRVEGYSWRGYAYEGKKPPRWHVRAWLLRHPWIDDADIGPTWNAYIDGAGYWREGGALSKFYDRFCPLLDEKELSQERPVAEIDVTAALTEVRFGPDYGKRLRTVADNGFIISKAELSNPEYGDKGLCTGVARIWVKEPELVVKMRPARATAALAELPPAVDVTALAEKLRSAGGDGVPTTRIAENLEELADAWRKRRRAQMPQWMWERVQEVWDVPPYWGIDHGYDWFSFVMKALDSGDRQKYGQMIQKILAIPPGWFAGHQHIEFIIPLLECPELLPEVVRYHLRLSFQARWQRPLRPDLIFAHGKVTGMGTLNHMANVRPKALLGAEVVGMCWLVEKAQYGLSLLNRMMIYSDGFSQELGDSYYRGITLAPLQAAARYSADPLSRLKASLMVEKLLFEDISTYHPGLRHRVSRISRRMGGLPQLMLEQDVPEAALHTLSKQGVLIEMDAPGPHPEVHGMRVFNMHATPPVRVALMAPWGREWEANAIDRKPLPFRTVFSTYVMRRVDEPIHAMTYMGQNYALASEEAYTSATVPVFAAWRRSEHTVERLEDMGIMLLRGRINEEPTGVLDVTPFGVLQHGSKLIYAIKPHERKFIEEGHDNLPDSVKDGLTSFKAQVALIAYGPDEDRELWIGGKRVDGYPALARHGDIITIREGVTYIGLIALPATDLGRKEEVVIRHEYPLLTLDSYVLQSDEPLPKEEETWRALSDATAGWVVEFGDVSEYGSFGAFQRHMRQVELKTRWAGEERILHVFYRSGEDTLEMGFRSTFEREVLWHQQLPPSQVFAYQRVNGKWPWPPRGIDLDNPLGQMGKAARLEKAGATLKTVEGQMAFLKVEPISGTYVGINPFIDPTPFELCTPEGVVIRSDGPLGCGRVTVCPKENTLWVDYHLPPPEGERGVELLQQERPEFFRPGVDVKLARKQSARALLVGGMEQTPNVILNGRPLRGPFARLTVEGKTFLRIPIVIQKPLVP